MTEENEEIPAHQRMTMRQLVEAAYVEGWRRSLEAYSIWKNGEQLTAMGRNMRAEQARAPETCKDEFERWLARQRETFSGRP